jgi:chemotaxis protein MotB
VNERQLHDALGRALQAARVASATGASPPVSGTSSAGSPTSQRLTPLQRGRYSRWHADPDPVPEEEGWLLTYLDVMTLLLVMLVVMLAFSEPISRKPPLGRPMPTTPGTAAAAAPQSPIEGGQIVPPLVESPSGPGEQPHHQRAPAAPDVSPSSTAGPNAQSLGLTDLGQDIQILVRDDGVSIRIPSEVLFASGEAGLTPAGQAVIDRLLPAFNRLPDYTVVVEGHTDNVPIQTARFPSNWELSAARASSVVRHLEARGLNPTRLRATGYADTRPLAPNDTPQGRALNRRVEITLEPPVRPRH